MSLTSQNPELSSSKMRDKKFIVTKFYTLRKRFKNNNSIELSSKNINSQGLCELLCKPVSVNITKLSISEIKEWCEKNPYIAETQDELLQKKELKYSGERIKKNIRERKSKYHFPQRVLLRNRTKIENKKLLVRDISKNVKQPYIKLHRIDEVINKIAQSFAKATPIKECETSAQTECRKEIQTELNVPTPEQLELSSLNVNKDEYLEDHKTNPTVIKSHTNEIEQSNKYVGNENDISDSDSNLKLYVKDSKRYTKRTRDIYESNDSDVDKHYDNVNNDLHKIRLIKVKRLRTNSLEKAMKVSLINQDHTSIESQHTDDSQKLQVESSTELNISNELCNSTGENDLNINECESMLQQKSSIPENIPIMNNHDNDDLDKNIKERNTSNCVSSELNFVSFANDNICINDDFVATEEPIVENRNIQESIQKSFIPDKDLIQKYNLFKELKVILIKFDSLNIFNRKQSATENEKIINIYMNSLTNVNLSKVQVYKRDEISSTPSPLKVVEPMICDTPSKNEIHAVAKETENITEPLSRFLKKSSQKVIKNVKQKEMLKTQNTCRNLTEHFEDNSQKRFKQNIISDLKQKTIVPTLVTSCTPLSSSQKSTKKISPILSNINENTIVIEKSANTSPTRPVIESIYKMSSLNKEMQTSSHEEDSTKLITNAKSPEKIKVNILNVINHKSYSLNQNEKLLAPGTKTNAPKTLKKPANITQPNKIAKISTSNYYSSIISPPKHKKVMDKKDAKNTTYKCIVCDLYFEDYSDLQPHLITHTQKQSNTAQCSSKDYNELFNKSEDTILYSSETEISGPSQILEQNSIEHPSPSKTVTNDDNKQEKKTDTPKRLLNKEKKKKKIQSISNSNECSICLKVFPTKSDLAAHIYFHTERELQEAYKLAKQKLNENGNSTVNNTIHTNEKTQKVNDKEELLHRQKLNKPLITKDSEIQNRESNAVIKNDLQGLELCLSLKSNKEKPNKVENSNKSFTICECHNKSGTNENCLQIEIVLLCHTCRVLFRSMECFENHYRLPEHIECNQNRFSSGRSPNLFCATCGMIFSSVQDVRHHLEIHARFKNNYRIDFRCNICKVLFLGIGTLFYIHWSKHARDPFWVANEQSFPKYSIINTKLRKIDNLSMLNTITSSTSTEGYIQVAENVCYNCKLPFVTTDDLKKHVRICNGIKSDQNIAAVGNSSTSIQSHLTIKITCSLCNDTFTKRSEFHKHIKDKHSCNNDPQFVCISFTAAKMVFICSICMAITENLDDFEDHWLKHNITHVSFACSQCNQIFRNSLNSFIEHGKEHKTGSDVLNCIANYEKTKFICNFCNIGFDSSKSMQEHNVIHKLNKQQTNSETNEVINNASTASESEVNHVSSLIEAEELPAEKQSAEVAEVVEKINEATLTGSTAANEKEKLIKMLEGSEDDSEHELIIDLTKHTEDCELLKAEESKERLTSFNIKLDMSPTNQSCPILKNDIVDKLETSIDIPSSPQMEDAIATCSFTSKNIIPLVSSQDTTLNSQISNSNIKLVNVPRDSHAFSNDVSNDNLLDTKTKSESDLSIMENVESIQDNKAYNIDSTVNQEAIPNVLPPPIKSSSPKPKPGFLRVKTLAELCGCTVENTNRLTEEHKNDGSTKDGKKCKIVEKELFPKQPIGNNKNKVGESSTSIAPQSNTYLLPSSNTVYRKLLPKIQSITNITNSQQFQQLQMNAAQNRLSSSPKVITSAYHKNLPACNIVRTTTAIPRSAALKSDIAPMKSMATISSVPSGQRANSTFSSNNEIKEMSSFAIAINPNDQYKYRCRYCNFQSNDITECLMHNLPGTKSQCKQHNAWSNQRPENENVQRITPANILPKNPNYKQYQQTVINQPVVKCSSSPICYQYLAAGSSNNDSNAEVLKQNQQIIANQQVAGSASSSIYYKNMNHSTGGMSIVINQTAPSVQNIPAIGILQQPAQQQIYQSQIYTEPVSLMNSSYIQQSQNLINLPGSNNVYQVTNNQRDMSNRQPTITSYEVRFACPSCSQIFVSENLLQMHMKCNHNFICDTCNLRFYNFDDYNLHKAKHNLI